MAPSPVMSFLYTTKPPCHGTFFFFLFFSIGLSLFLIVSFFPHSPPPPPFSTFLVHHLFVLFVHDDFRGHLGGFGPCCFQRQVSDYGYFRGGVRRLRSLATSDRYRGQFWNAMTYDLLVMTDSKSKETSSVARENRT